MADGILHELSTAIIGNVELIVLVAVPLAALIGWIGKKINERILSVSDDTTENIQSYQKDIAKEIDDVKKRATKLESDLIKLQDDMHKLELHVKLAINSLEIRTENKRVGGNRRDI